jgi:site-specific DNA recombinase
LWVGGIVPLGYYSKDRKITIVEKEAEAVRHIFKRYLELGSLGNLLTDLRQDGIASRRRQLASGKVVGGIPFNRGGLVWMLRNRFYIGEIRVKGEIFPGEQPKIIDRELFDAVQAKLDQQRTNHVTAREASDSLLMGRIFDDAGHLMTPVHSLRRGRRYRYYVSSALVKGQASAAGEVRRVPADQVEALVLKAMRADLEIASDENDRQLLKCLVQIEVSVDHLTVHVAPPDGLSAAEQRKDKSHPKRCARKGRGRTVIRIPWKKRPSKMPREIIPPADGTDRIDVRPIRSETRAKLIGAIK